MTSIYEMIAKEAAEQMIQEGRPLVGYILTPEQMAAFRKEVEAAAHFSSDARVDTAVIEIYLQSQGTPCRVVEGP